MTVNEAAERLHAKVLTGDGEREITGIYACDLLSWVISHAEQGNMWVTVMNNVNILAVASLTDVACVVISDGSPVDPDLIQRAREQEICLLSCELGTAPIVWKTAELLGEV
jgi:hypothetical protein